MKFEKVSVDLERLAESTHAVTVLDGGFVALQLSHISRLFV
jgi:hypothetical protein